MNDKVKALTELIDDALAVAEERLAGQREDKYYGPALEAIITGLRYHREQALNGTLPPSEGNRNLGLARAVLDWDSQYSELVKACVAVDMYYEDNFR
jgi:hypothetical protein